MTCGETPGLTLLPTSLILHTTHINTCNCCLCWLYPTLYTCHVSLLLLTIHMYKKLISFSTQRVENSFNQTSTTSIRLGNHFHGAGNPQTRIERALIKNYQHNKHASSSIFCLNKTYQFPPGFFLGGGGGGFTVWRKEVVMDVCWNIWSILVLKLWVDLINSSCEQKKKMNQETWTDPYQTPWKLVNVVRIVNVINTLVSSCSVLR